MAIILIIAVVHRESQNLYENHHVIVEGFKVYSICHTYDINFSGSVHEQSFHFQSSTASSNIKFGLVVVGVSDLGQIIRICAALAVDVLAY